MGLYLFPFADARIPAESVAVKRFNNMNLIYIRMVYNIKRFYIIYPFALYMALPTSVLFYHIIHTYKRQVFVSLFKFDKEMKKWTLF
jgi:hypothetical protein